MTVDGTLITRRVIEVKEQFRSLTKKLNQSPPFRSFVHSRNI